MDQILSYSALHTSKLWWIQYSKEKINKYNYSTLLTIKLTVVIFCKVSLKISVVRIEWLQEIHLVFKLFIHSFTPVADQIHNRFLLLLACCCRQYYSLVPWPSVCKHVLNPKQLILRERASVIDQQCLYNILPI